MLKRIYKVGDLFEGQLSLNIPVSQKAFLAFLTQEAFKEIIESGKPMITKTNVELLVASNNLYTSDEIKSYLRVLKRRKLVHSLRVGRKKVLMVNDKFFTGITMPVIACDYMTETYSNHAGDSLVLSAALKFACENFENSKMFYTDLEQILKIRETINVTARGYRDYLHELESHNLIIPCLSYPVNKRNITLPCMFEEELMSEYYFLQTYRKNKLKTIEPFGNSYLSAQKFEGTLIYSIKTKLFTLIDEEGKKLPAFLDEGDLIDFHLNTRTIRSIAGKKENEWFFPNVPLSSIEDKDPRCNIKVTIYKKPKNAKKTASIGKQEPAAMSLDEFVKDLKQKSSIFKK